jgi:two-component system, NtrC family, sensor kinase
MESMAGGGRMTIGGGSDPENQTVWLTIADTGHGISSEELTRIFDPFYSTKLDAKGVGLGLSMVYGIIREHTGTIEVQSDPGKGTQFKIALPVKAA